VSSDVIIRFLHFVLHNTCLFTALFWLGDVLLSFGSGSTGFVKGVTQQTSKSYTTQRTET